VLLSQEQVETLLPEGEARQINTNIIFFAKRISELDGSFKEVWKGYKKIDDENYEENPYVILYQQIPQGIISKTRLINELKISKISHVVDREKVISWSHWALHGNLNDFLTEYQIVRAENGKRLFVNKEDNEIIYLFDVAQFVNLLILAVEGYMHSDGIAHRDLKPENIVVTEYGPKIIDFGLATMQKKEANGIPPNLQRATSARGERFSGNGTLKYMDPYIFTGLPEDYDPVRHDIYSLGIILVDIFSVNELLVKPRGVYMRMGREWVQMCRDNASEKDKKEWIRENIFPADMYDISGWPEQMIYILLTYCVENNRERNLRVLVNARRLLNDHLPMASAQGSAIIPVHFGKKRSRRRRKSPPKRTRSQRRRKSPPKRTRSQRRRKSPPKRTRSQRRRKKSV